jgi:hypothetical protein
MALGAFFHAIHAARAALMMQSLPAAAGSVGKLSANVATQPTACQAACAPNPAFARCCTQLWCCVIMCNHGSHWAASSPSSCISIQIRCIAVLQYYANWCACCRMRKGGALLCPLQNLGCAGGATVLQEAQQMRACSQHREALFVNCNRYKLKVLRAAAAASGRAQARWLPTNCSRQQAARRAGPPHHQFCLAITCA